MKKKESAIKKSSFFSKKKVLSLAIGIFIMSIMILSVLDMWKGTDENVEIEYEDFKFVRSDIGWLGSKGNSKVSLSYSPRELKNISLKYADLSSLNYVGKVYISYNPGHNIRSAFQDFSRNIQITPPIFQACTADVPACADMKIITCDNSSQTTGVIIFQTGNNTGTSFIGNCLVVEGKDGEDLLKVTDRMILDYVVG